MTTTDRNAYKAPIKQKETGFSLIEVMVALMILLIGLLGVVGLQASAKRANFEAMQRSTATTIAQELIERIRANRTQLETYTKGTAGNKIVPLGLNAATCAAPSGCDSSADAGASIAAMDLYEVQLSLQGITEQIGANCEKDPLDCAGGLVSPIVCLFSTPLNAGSQIPAEVRVSVAWRGMTKLSDPTLDDCGQGDANYDDKTGDGAYRRVLQLISYIN